MKGNTQKISSTRFIKLGLVMVGFMCYSAAFTQGTSETPNKDWFVLDPTDDRLQGVSANKAYETILKNKKSKTVTVAVIDSGIDIDHEDLKDKIWINEDEIDGNGIDDDKNGYIDDRYGWNFIGGKNGNVEYDTYELTRVYVDLKAKYGDIDKKKVKKKNKKEYEKWLEIKDEFENIFEESSQQYAFYSFYAENLLRYESLLKSYLDIDNITINDLRSINTQDSIVLMARNIIGVTIQNFGADSDLGDIASELKESADYFEEKVKYSYNVDFKPRSIVGDNYGNINEKYYGNNDVKGHDPSHGTHVAGIIGANRNNDLGIKGIANDVKIMAIRAVPDGDERDKDVANAIIYAVDNGAQIINMSFGKDYSPNKEAVDKAIKYAESKGVLLVHAAGNDGRDIDKGGNFPTKRLDENTTASNWLEIGASSWGDNADFVGSFSNYGKEVVDVFAPGVEVYSTTPNNEYDSYDGTSMAAPATSGVAALILSYYPSLTIFQVKEIIKNSSRKFGSLEVNKPGEEDTRVKFDELSNTGGLINAYEALKLAESMTLKQGN